MERGMAVQTLLKALCHGFLGALIWVQQPYAETPHPFPPPGTYERSSIGNSFGIVGVTQITQGTGGYGYGQWVQDYVGAMAVSPDGTVFNETLWDEGAHALGLYKNGEPNSVPVAAFDTPLRGHTFNSQGTAICVDGDSFFVASSYKLSSALVPVLLRFSWKPGDINSAQYSGDVPVTEVATSLSCANGKILIGYPDQIELRDEASMQLSGFYPAKDIQSVLLAPDGSFWVIAGNAVHHLQADGTDTGVTLPNIGAPVSLAWSNNGKLIVSDNGPAQQVLFFDVSGQPRLTSTFGVKGGLYSGVPGAVAPQKLFALRGAGMDAQGNLYVGMSFDLGANGNAFIRAFSPAGNMLWEDYATAFVDTFGFQPGSDGTVVFGRMTRWHLDLSRHSAGSEASLTAITFDPFRYPDDPRLELRALYAVYPRLIDGTQLLYADTQYGQGFTIFAGAPGTYILHQVGSSPNTGWAWDVTDDGDIWNGDFPGKKIALYKLKSVTDGVPVYDWQHPRTWPWPADFNSVNRVIYNKATDSLYVFGWFKGQGDRRLWGVVGLTARRYDGWLSGNPHTVWTNTALPTLLLSASGEDISAPGKDVSLAGNYLFIGMLRDAGGPGSIPRVNILNANTGKFVGMLTSGPEVGLYGGWEDRVGSVQATMRKNGEYLILVEDDEHARNLLFRWKP
jgi:hypothetical protein